MPRRAATAGGAGIGRRSDRANASGSRAQGHHRRTRTGAAARDLDVPRPAAGPALARAAARSRVLPRGRRHGVHPGRVVRAARRRLGARRRASRRRPHRPDRSTASRGAAGGRAGRSGHSGRDRFGQPRVGRRGRPRPARAIAAHGLGRARPSVGRRSSSVRKRGGHRGVAASAHTGRREQQRGPGPGERDVGQPSLLGRCRARHRRGRTLDGGAQRLAGRGRPASRAPGSPSRSPRRS